jgi:hypothetical protein
VAGLEVSQNGYARILEVIDREEDLIGGIIETIERLEVCGHVVVDVLDGLEKADEGIFPAFRSGRFFAPAERNCESREKAENYARYGQEHKEQYSHRLICTWDR